MANVGVNTTHISETLLITILVFSFILAAFCAASEIGILSLNRYRLRHLAKTDKRARRIQGLLSHPDRLLGAILVGNTFATALGSSVSNDLAGRSFGELGIVLSPFIFTIVLLIFAESAPKTVAALKPEATSFFVSRPLQIMLWLLYPLVIFITAISNTFLRLFGLKPGVKTSDALSREEFRTVVNEAGGLIPRRHQSMLLSILDLEKVRVDHIMVPRNEVVGIDLDDDPNTIVQALTETQHTLLPVYRSDLDNVQGIFHTRNVAKVITKEGLNLNALLKAVDEPYFVPEGTSLHTQLLNFQLHKRRLALVVDEYGDVQGLVTLEDILEEIVGEFTTGASSIATEVQAQDDGSYIIDGTVSLRELNRMLHWDLPTDGPATLNGLILETLERIPEEGICFLINDYPIEVIQVKDNAVKNARIAPKVVRKSEIILD